MERQVFEVKISPTSSNNDIRVGSLESLLGLFHLGCRRTRLILVLGTRSGSNASKQWRKSSLQISRYVCMNWWGLAENTLNNCRRVTLKVMMDRVQHEKICRLQGSKTLTAKRLQGASLLCRIFNRLLTICEVTSALLQIFQALLVKHSNTDILLVATVHLFFNLAFIIFISCPPSDINSAMISWAISDARLRLKNYIKS